MAMAIRRMIPLPLITFAMASSVSGIGAHFGGEDTDSLNAALAAAHAHDGLSVVHVPVYCGPRSPGWDGSLWFLECWQLVSRRANALSHAGYLDRKNYDEPL